MNTKSFLLLVSCFSVMVFKTHAQKNVVKLNLPSLAFRNIYMSYERVLTENKSVNIGLAFMPSRSFFTGRIADDVRADNDNKIKYGNIRMSGFSVTPEFRFYTSSSKEAPRGFYLAPYLRYQNLTFKGEYTKSYTSNDYPLEAKHTGHFNGKGNYSVMAAGCQLGVQWLIADRFSIDWSFFGIGLGSYKLEFTESSDDAGKTYYNVGGLGDFDLDWMPFNPKYSRTQNSRTGSMSTLLPHFRSGLSIGFAF